MNCYDCPVWKNSLFKDFGDNQLAWVAQHKTMHVLKRDEQLFLQGEIVKGIYCHQDGLVKVVQKDGAEKIRFSRLVTPGDTSGHRSIFVDNTYKGTASVISDQLHACFISNEAVLKLLSSYSSFARNLIIRISSELHRSEEEQISVKVTPVRNRLAKFLFDLCKDYSEPIEGQKIILKSEITKREIASILMVANETIIRLMSEMKMEGLIEYQNKKIVVVDFENLERLSKLYRN